MDENIMRNASQYANTTDSTGFGDVAWREVFTDPQLQALIQEGLDNNDDIFAAAANIQKMEAALACSRLAFLPSVAFSPQGTLSKVLTGDHKSDWSKSYTLPVSASWTVDLFGNILSQKRGAEMQLEMMKDYEHLTHSLVICGIANAYYTLLMLDRQLEITRNTEQLTKKTYDLMVAQKKLAGADESAVQSARANYLSVQASIPEIERQIRETENALSVLLCEAPHQIPRGKLDQQSLPETFSVGVPVQVLSNRPDVHAAEMKLANCYYNVNRARAAFYPALTISGQAAWTNSGGMGIVNPGKLLAAAVASVTQPIFARGQLTAQLRVAQAQQEQAFLAWQQSVLNAGSEVSNALMLYQSSTRRSALLAEQTASLERNVEVAEKMFKMSQNYNYLNIISAQQSLLQAQLSKVSNDFYRMQAVVNLYYALGGGQK
jgi:NodT family efflux transporter outer membrane factor (OMF) lipoprotein